MRRITNRYKNITTIVLITIITIITIIDNFGGEGCSDDGECVIVGAASNPKRKAIMALNAIETCCYRIELHISVTVPIYHADDQLPDAVRSEKRAASSERTEWKNIITHGVE